VSQGKDEIVGVQLVELLSMKGSPIVQRLPNVLSAVTAPKPAMLFA
jgi:hypothetical protein